MGSNIRMQGFRTLPGSKMDALETEKMNKRIVKLPGIDIMLFVTIISLLIHVLSLTKWFDNSAKYEKLTDKIQYLERSINEMKNNIHTKTEEFRTESDTPLHY